MHEFMKLTKMFGMIVISVSSKYGQLITSFMHSRDNIRKNKNNKKLKGRKPLSQDFVHFEPVESPINPSTMDSPGE
jgi:hypothetical protein